MNLIQWVFKSNIKIDLQWQTKTLTAELFTKVLHKDLPKRSMGHTTTVSMDAAPPVLDT